MRDFIAKISLTALFVLAIFSASAAEKVTFEANSPLTVAVGEPFRVEFALNAQPEPGSFKAPSFEGFDVIANERFHCENIPDGTLRAGDLLGIGCREGHF